jgi:hypothetical protein
MFWKKMIFFIRYVDTYFNLSDDSANDIFDSDSDVRTTSLREQL